MDKTILKKFAIESRKDLMEKISNKIKTFYVEEEFKSEQKGDLYILSNEKHTLSLTNEEFKKRELLIKRIKELSLEGVIEEAAYTWFNRIIAIRYMEIHDYLPLTKDNQSLGIRVLSSKDNTPDPEIMKFTNLVNPDLDINFDKEKYMKEKNKEDGNNKVYKYVLLLVCKKLGRVIPQVFDGVTDYIDILIPDNLLNDTGFITKVISEVPEENYNQVEIIGWLYQYYNQTEKDRVISAKKAYKKNEIAYATQLFTPDWIVKYMVENSLGKYWIEHSSNDTLIDNWKYFIKDNITKNQEKLNPTEITFIDPCCGSGHILVYAFEVLYQIYLSTGYNKNDIPELILKNNLYGLDIDDRAGQLSILSVLLKAREYDKNIFNKDIVKNLNIMSIQESNTINESSIDCINSEIERENAKYLIDNFKNAKEIGSLLILENKDYSNLIKELESNDTIFTLELREKLNPIIKISNILTKKYDVVVTNPPYMNNSVMSNNLKDYLLKNYKDSKVDLCTTFMEYRGRKTDGYQAMINQHSWMFLSSFENLRKKFIENEKIDSMVHLGTRAFEEIGGEVVQTTAFVIKKDSDGDSLFVRLVDFDNASLKEQKYLEILNSHNEKYLFNKNAKEFNKIPGSPIAYWVSNNLIKIFNNYGRVDDVSETKQGMTTSDNKRFLRLWFEVVNNKIGYDINSLNEAIKSEYKWFKYNKGGEYRKWFGNDEYIVNYFNGGEEMEAFHNELNKTSSGGRIKNKEFYFRKCISWSKISSASLAFRYKESGFIFDVAGSSIFSERDDILKYLLGVYNSKLGMHIIGQISPTLNFEAEQIKQMPLIILEKDIIKVNKYVDENIKLSKQDWDSFETSWDFKSHPLIEFRSSMIGLGDGEAMPEVHYDIVRNSYNEQIFIAKDFPFSSTIEGTCKRWEEYCDNQFNKLKQNEEELNRIFIEIYGLQDELTPEVEDKDVTIRKADRVREVKSLISYAVGCMFGRYSLDEQGLVYAGGEFDNNKYKTFKADADNIIPITDEAYFGDDIVERFKVFIKTVYGDNTFNENMDFIAETLGKKGTETSEDTIRRYFLNDFFNDHTKIYQKRPIYWLFDSGRKNGFKALVYMHRYNENLIPKVRLDYLHRIQTTYEKLLSDVNDKLKTELSMSDKKTAQNRQADLNAKLTEIKEYDEKIAHIANQRISIDLDDGVKVNYDKFKDILAKIK